MNIKKNFFKGIYMLQNKARYKFPYEIIEKLSGKLQNENNNDDDNNSSH